MNLHKEYYSVVHVFINTNWGSIFFLLMSAVGSDSCIVYTLFRHLFWPVPYSLLHANRGVLICERVNFFWYINYFGIQLLNVHFMNY